MRHLVRNCLAIALSLLGMHAAVATAAAAAPTSQYTMTVNKDRLQNALNEPQNWLMMNGDYGSIRYSKLTQIFCRMSALSSNSSRRVPERLTLIAG